jgi:hypothetical protein
MQVVKHENPEASSKGLNSRALSRMNQAINQPRLIIDMLNDQLRTEIDIDQMER